MDYGKLWKENRQYISRPSLDPQAVAEQFTKTESRGFLVIGTVDLPSGRIRVGDPLSYMCSGVYSPEADISVPPGSYPVEISLVYTPFDRVRICTSRLKLSDKPAVRYEPARSTEDTAAFKSSDGCFAAFPVEAGMMAFADAQTAEEFARWCMEWHSRNPEGNHYDDYFEKLFAESAERLPDFQRSGGDFIEWALPGSGKRMTMNAAGFGDGLYQAFWGFDEDGLPCELTVPLIDPAAMEQASEEYLAEWDGTEACIVTRHISEGGDIGYMSRTDTGDDKTYNGWIFYGYDEDEEYWDDPDNFELYSTHRLIERFPEIAPLLRSPAGTSYFAGDGGEFVRDEGQE